MTNDKKLPIRGHIKDIPNNTLYHILDELTKIEAKPRSTIPEPLVVDDWECPICGSPKFDAQYAIESVGPFGYAAHGTVFRIVSYFCAKCTVQFRNPAKFSKNRGANGK